MSELTKKHRIEIHFVGPLKNKNKAVEFLEDLGFEEVSDSVPWREAFPEYTEETAPRIALLGARTKEDLTQQELATLTGIPQSHLSEMETGKRPIGKKNAKRLAEALNINYRLFL